VKRIESNFTKEALPMVMAKDSLEFFIEITENICNSEERGDFEATLIARWIEVEEHMIHGVTLQRMHGFDCQEKFICRDITEQDALRKMWDEFHNSNLPRPRKGQKILIKRFYSF